jgi:hypothetical protein
MAALRFVVVGATAGTYDLWYDATCVGVDLVVECWISPGPRAHDSSFDPQPGDHVSVGDDEEAPLRARVVRRQGDRVAVHVRIAAAPHVVAQGFADKP